MKSDREDHNHPKLVPELSWREQKLFQQEQWWKQQESVGKS
tara:strand:- start:265 stop:387 length:123 start_codon:yes stop_codon:yes gene_type:complete